MNYEKERLLKDFMHTIPAILSTLFLSILPCYLDVSLIGTIIFTLMICLWCLISNNKKLNKEIEYLKDRFPQVRKIYNHDVTWDIFKDYEDQEEKL